MISVIVPFYRGDDQLPKAIASCAPGSKLGAEIIIVVDSPETTSDYFHKLRENENHAGLMIQTVRHERNLGAAQARKTGMKYARHNYVIMLDQDDELTPERFSNPPNAQTDIQLFQTITKTEDKETLEPHRNRLLMPGFVRNTTINQLLATRRQPARFGAITMTRKTSNELLSPVGGGGEEWEFFMSAFARSAKVEYVNKVGLIRHVDGQNTSIKDRDARLAKWLQRI